MNSISRVHLSQENRLESDDIEYHQCPPPGLYRHVHGQHTHRWGYYEMPDIWNSLHSMMDVEIMDPHTSKDEWWMRTPTYKQHKHLSTCQYPAIVLYSHKVENKNKMWQDEKTLKSCTSWRNVIHIVSCRCLPIKCSGNRNVKRHEGDLLLSGAKLLLLWDSWLNVGCHQEVVYSRSPNGICFLTSLLSKRYLAQAQMVSTVVISWATRLGEKGEWGAEGW